MEDFNVAFYVQKDGYELKALAYVENPDLKSNEEMYEEAYKTFEGTDAVIDENEQIEWEWI